LETSDDARAVLAQFGRATTPRVVPIFGGADARLWRVDGWGAPCALRLLGPDRVDQAAREQTVMAQAQRAGLPVPKILASTVWRGHPALLIEWMPGGPLADALVAQAGDPSAVTVLGERFGALLAAIHRVAAPSGLPTDWPNWPCAKPELAACLQTIELRPPALLHLDFHPLNVLVERNAMTAVLDWANAHVGDPRADLARTLAILELSPLPAPVDPVRSTALRPSFGRAWRRGYQTAGGSFAGLAPFCWWAGEAMEQDLARLDRTRIPWLTSEHDERVRAWTAAWRARARRSLAGGDRSASTGPHRR